MKLVVFEFYCESAIFMTKFLLQKVKCENLLVIKLYKFLLQFTIITFIGSIDPHIIFFVGTTKGKM